ncbi:MAG: hypothetical protein RLY57_496 [Candidatus Parcubacteria bacterium]|jgi:hypothetical protein
MFISTKRPIVIPQSEHAKIAAAIASLWGNKDFEKSNLPHESFVKGVILHDRGFGEHDNHELMSLTKEARLHTLKSGIEQISDDHVADAVTLMHIKRLIEMYPKEEMEELAELCNKTLEEKIQLSGFQKTEYDFADKITEIADDIAFDFSLEENSSGEVCVYKKRGDETITSVTFIIKENVISMTPWPLSVDYYEGSIVGYEKEGYPQSLKAHIIPFFLKK